MKQWVLLLSIIQSSITLYGQFNSVEFLFEDSIGPRPVKVLDVDQDGFQDIVSAYTATGEIVVFFGTGTTEFLGPDTIFDGAPHLASLAIADLNGDSWADVLFRQNEDLYWLVNLGNGSFGYEQLISDSAYFTTPFTSADVDSDGDIDLLVASLRDSSCYILHNNGAGLFIDSTYVDTLLFNNFFMQFEEVFFTDADVNGTMDLVLMTSSNSYQVPHWRSNDGSANFTFGDTIEQFTPIPVFVADIDLDGDEDLISYGYLYRNDGQGAYSVENFFEPCPGLLAREIYDIDDADNDGDLDIILVTKEVGPYQFYYFNWYETINGLPSDCRSISPSLDHSYVSTRGAYIDVDNDSLLEFVQSNSLYVSLYDSINVPFSEEFLLFTTSAAGTVQELIDIDNDNDLDLVSSGGELGYIVANINDNMEFRPSFIHWTGVKRTVLMTSGDITGNGLADLLIADTDSVYWFSNGNYLSGIEGALLPRGNKRKILLADLNSDGLDDILCLDSALYWYTNLGANSYGSAQLILDSTNVIYELITEDLDQDGDMDILYTYPSIVGILENQGGGIFSLPIIQDTLLVYPRSLEAWDLDDDPELEVVYRTYNSMHYMDRVGGVYQVVSWILPTNFYATNFGDHENDGDIDIVTYNTVSGRDELHINDGTGIFSILELDSFPSNKRYFIEDINGDGSTDIFMNRKYAGQSYYWYQNNGLTTSFEEVTDHQTMFFQPNPFVERTQLYLGDEFHSISSWELIDIMGKTVRTGFITGKMITIERNGLPTGIYVLRLIQNDSVVESVKLIAE